MKKKLVIGALAVSPLATLMMTSGAETSSRLLINKQGNSSDGVLNIQNRNGTQEWIDINRTNDTSSVVYSDYKDDDNQRSRVGLLIREGTQTRYVPNSRTDGFFNVELLSGVPEYGRQKWKVTLTEENFLRSTTKLDMKTFFGNILISDDFKVIQGSDNRGIKFNAFENSPGQRQWVEVLNEGFDLNKISNTTYTTASDNRKVFVGNINYQPALELSKLSPRTPRNIKSTVEGWFNNQLSYSFKNTDLTEQTESGRQKVRAHVGSYLTFTYSKKVDSPNNFKLELTFETEKNYDSPHSLWKTDVSEDGTIAKQDGKLFRRGKSFVGVSGSLIESSGLVNYDVTTLRAWERNKSEIRITDLNEKNTTFQNYEIVVRKNITQDPDFVQTATFPADLPNLEIVMQESVFGNDPIRFLYRITNDQPVRGFFTNQNENSFTTNFKIDSNQDMELFANKLDILANWPTGTPESIKNSFEISTNPDYYFDSESKRFFIQINYKKKKTDEASYYKYWKEGEYKIYESNIWESPLYSSAVYKDVHSTSLQTNENVRTKDLSVRSNIKNSFSTLFNKIDEIFKDPKYARYVNYAKRDPVDDDRSWLIKKLFEGFTSKDRNYSMFFYLINPLVRLNNNVFGNVIYEYERRMFLLRENANKFNKDYIDYANFMNNENGDIRDLEDIIEVLERNFNNFKLEYLSSTADQNGIENFDISRLNRESLKSHANYYDDRQGYVKEMSISSPDFYIDSEGLRNDVEPVNFSDTNSREFFAITPVSTYATKDADNLRTSSQGNKNLTSQEVAAILKKDPEFANVYNEIARRYSKLIYDFIYENNISGVNYVNNLRKLDSISYEEQASSLNVKTKQIKIRETDLNNKGYLRQMQDIYTGMKSEYDLASNIQNRPASIDDIEDSKVNNTLNAAHVMYRDWQKMITDLKNKIWETKVNSLPYISKAIKDTVNAEIKKVSAEDQKQRIYDAARRLSGDGFISDTSSQNVGSAKSLLRLYNVVHARVKNNLTISPTTGFYESPQDTNLQNLDLDVLFGRSSKYIRDLVLSDKDFTSQELTDVAEQVGTTYTKSEGYSDFKAHKVFSSSEIRSRGIVALLDGFSQTLNRLRTSLDASFRRLNGASVLIEETATLTQKKANVTAEQYVNTYNQANESQKATIRSEITARFKKEIEVYNGEIDETSPWRRQGTSNNLDWKVEITDIKNPNSTDGSVDVVYRIVRPLENSNGQAVTESAQQLKTRLDQENQGNERIFTITGFKTRSLQDDINKLNVSVTYPNAQHVLASETPPTPANKAQKDVYQITFADPEGNLSITPLVWEGNNDSGFYTFTIDGQKVKIVELKQTNIPSPDTRDANGTMKVSLKVVGYDNPAESRVFSDIDLSGFKTEQTRLNELKTNTTTTGKLSSVNDSSLNKNLTPETFISDPNSVENVKNLLNNQVYKNDDEKAQVIDLVLSKSSNDSDVVATYRLQSTRNGLTAIESSNSSDKKFTKVFTGFLTPAKEAERLAKYRIKSISYPSSENSLLSDLVTLQKSSLQIQIQEWDSATNTWKASTQPISSNSTANDRFTFDQAQAHILFSDINFDAITVENDRNGQVGVSVALTSSKQGLSTVKAASVRANITGFKTEQTRLNELKTSKHSELNTKDFTEDKKQRSADQVTQDEILDLLKDLYTSNGANIYVNSSDSSNNIEIEKNATNGTVTVKYQLVSTKLTNEPKVLSNTEKETKTFTGFATEANEQQRINNFDVEIDYQEKTKLITETDFDKTKLTIKIRQKSSDQNSEWINGTLNQQGDAFRFTSANGQDQFVKVELSSINFKNTKLNSLDQNGTLTPALVLKTTKTGLSAQSKVDDKTITGFKTEKARLEELKNTRSQELDELTLDDQSKSPLFVTDEEIKNKLNTFFATNNAKVLDSSLEIEKDPYSGTISVKFNLVSTRDMLQTVSTGDASSKHFQKTFTQSLNEEQRINQINPSVDDSRTKLQILLSKQNPSLSDLKFTFEYQQKRFESSFDQGSNSFTFAAVNGLDPMVKIVSVNIDTISNLNDQNGTYTVDYTLESTANKTSQQTTAQKQISDAQISGFKTEQMRLQELKNSRSNEIESLEYMNLNRAANSVSDQEVIDLLNNFYKGKQDEAKVYVQNGSDNLSIVKNADGTIAVTYRLTSDRDQLRDSNIVTSSEQSNLFTKTFSGFTTEQKEVERLNSYTLVIDHAGKESLVTSANVSSQTLSIKARSNDTNQEYEGTFQNDKFVFDSSLNFEVLLSDIVINNGTPISNSNDINGSFEAKAKLTSTITGLSAKSKETGNQISGFLTEQQRLTKLINETSITDLFSESEKQGMPSAFFEDQVKEKLNAKYDSSKEEISDYTITIDDTTGQITVNYKLVSKRSDLTNQKSTTNKTETFQFQTEAQRLTDLINQIQIDYNDKSKLPSETEFVPNSDSETPKLRLTLNGETASYTNNEWVFSKAKAKVKKITVSESNDIDGTARISIDKLVSTKPNVTAESSNDSNKEEVIDGFFTEQKRLNKVGNENKPEQISLDNVSDITASDSYDKNLLLPKFVEHFGSSVAKVKDFVSLAANAQDGSITVTYKLNSEKTTPTYNQDMTNVQSSDVFTTKFTGFATSNTEQERINAFDSEVDHTATNKKSILIAKDQPTIDNLKFTISKDGKTFEGAYDAQKQAYIFQPKDGVNPNAQIKVDSIQIQPITNANDENGSFTVSYKLTSTIVDLANPKAFDNKSISGFKTEQERLNELIQNAAKTQVITSADFDKEYKKVTFANDVTDQKVKEVLDALFQESSDEAQVEVTQVNKNNENGTVEATFKLVSKRESLTSIKSSQTQSKTFSGLLNERDEKTRLDAYVVQVDYAQKESKLPLLDNIASQKENLVIKIQKDSDWVTGQWDGDKFTFDGLDVEVKADDITIPVTAENDKLGNVTPQILLSSSNANVTSKSVDKGQLISGFKTEVQRLNDLINSTDIDNIFTQEELGKSPSEVTSEEVKQKLNTLYQSSSATVSELSVTADDAAGTLSVSYKLQSSRTGLESEISDQTKDKTYNFQTEQERLNKLFEGITVSFTDKSNLPSETEFIPMTNNDSPNLVLTVDGETAKYVDGSWVFEKHKAKVTNLDIQNKNDETGSANVVITGLTSTKDSVQAQSNSAQKTETINQFKTEQQRLNEVGNTLQLTRQEVQNVKDRIADSSYSNDDLLSLINPSYQGQQAIVNSATASYDQNAGTITLNYQLNSTKGSLEHVQSSESFTTVFSGFATNNSEQSRIDSFESTVDYLAEDKKSILVSGYTKGGEKTLDKTKLSFTLTKDGKTYTSTYDSSANGGTGAYTFISEDGENPNVEIKLTDITWTPVSSEADLNGEIGISYEISTTVPGLTAERLVDDKSISGFKTEQERLNDVLQSVDISQKQFDDLVKQANFATDITKEQIEQLLNPLFVGKDVEVYIEQDPAADKDNGTISSSIKLRSTREDLESTTSSESKNKEFNGFLTESEEKAKLDAYNVTFDFANKATKLPNYDNLGSEENKKLLTIQIQKDSEPAVTGSWDEAKQGFTFDDKGVFIALSDITVNPTLTNDKNGTLTPSVILSSTNEKIQSKSDSKSSEINGFKTEQQRLDGYKTEKEANLSDLTLPVDRTVDQVLDSEITTAISNLYPDAQVKANPTITRNHASGTIDVTFQIESTRGGDLEGVTSTQTFAKQFTGFTSELERLNSFSITTLDYTGKQDIMLSDGALDKSKLIISITKDGVLYQGTADSDSNSFTFDSEAKVKINFDDIEFVNQTNIANDIAGTLNTVNIKLTSLNDQSVESGNKSNSISGFKTEQQRLNGLETQELIAQKQSKDLANKDKAANSVQKQEILDALANLYPDAKVIIENDSEIVRNNDQGTINVTYKLQSTRGNEGDSIREVKSSQTFSKQFTGLVTASTEQTRMDVLSPVVTYPEAQNQMLQGHGTNNPGFTDANKQNLLITINGEIGQKDDDGFVFANNKVKVLFTDITYTQPNSESDKTGTLTGITVKLTSTVENIDAKTEAKNVDNISGFKTEPARLDDLNKDDSSVKTQVGSLTLTPDLQQTLASAFTSAKAKELLDTIYNTEDNKAQVLESSIQLSEASDDTGTVKVSYKLVSTRDGLSDQESTQTFEKTFSGFYTNNDEVNRLNKLKIKSATYANTTDLVTNTTLEKQNVSLVLVKLDENGQEIQDSEVTGTLNGDAFEFNGLNAKVKLSDITIATPTNSNDRDGSIGMTIAKLSSTLTDSQVDPLNAPTSLNGFKTEQQRLNEEIAKAPTQKQVLNSDLITANDFTDEQIKAELSKAYSDAEIKQVSIDRTSNPEQISVTFDLVSTRDMLDGENAVTSSDSNRKTVVIGDFSTKETEKARMDKYTVGVTYPETTKTPSETEIDKTKFTVTLTKADGSTVTGVLNPEKTAFVFDSEKIQILLDDLSTNISTENDRNGQFETSAKLSTTVKGLEPTSENDKVSKTATVSGFQTEQERLKEVIKAEEVSENLITNVTRSPSQVPREEVMNTLDALFTDNNANVLDSDILEFSTNNNEGTITVKFKVSSNKTNITDVTSQDTADSENDGTKTVVLRGFLQTDDEQSRLNDLLQTVKVDYVDKSKLPTQSDIANNLENNLKLTIEKDGQNHTAVFKDGAWVFESLNAKVKTITPSNANDIDGTVKFTIDKLISTIDTTIESNNTDSKVSVVSDFETEQNRLNKLINNVSVSVDPEKTAENTKVLPSEITFADLTNKLLSDPENPDQDQSQQEKVQFLEENFDIVADDITGTLTVTPKVQTGKTYQDLINDYVAPEGDASKAADQKPGIISSPKAPSIVLNGFKTAQEVVDGYDLSKVNIDWANQEQPKANEMPSGESARNASNYESTFAPDAPNKDNFEITNLKVVGHDDISGKTLVEFNITDNSHTNPDGSKVVSKKFYKVVDGFKTEQDRLDEIANNMRDSMNFEKEATKSNDLLPSNVEVSNIKNDLIDQDSTVSYQENSPELRADDVLGRLTIDYTVKTSDDHKPNLFSIDEGVTLEDDSLFAQPANSDITSTNQGEIEGFKTKREVVDSEIDKPNPETGDLVNYLSPAEKDLLKSKTEEIENNYKQVPKVLEHDQAIEKFDEIENQTKLDQPDSLNALKKADYDSISAQNYPHLNQDQLDALKDQILNAVHNPADFENANPKPKSVEEVKQEAAELDAEMDKLAKKADNAADSNSDYIKLKNDLLDSNDPIMKDPEVKKEIDKYLELINLANEIMDNKVPSNKELAKSIIAPDTLPENANWNKDQVSKIVSELDKNVKEAFKKAIDSLNNLSDEEKDKLKSDIENISDENGESIYDQAKKVLDRAKVIEDKKQQAIDKINNLNHLSDENKDSDEDKQYYIDKIKNVSFVDPQEDQANEDKLNEIVDEAKKADLDKGIKEHVERFIDPQNGGKVSLDSEHKESVDSVNNLRNEVPKAQNNPDQADEKYSEQDKAIETLDFINELKDAYRTFLNSDAIDDPEFEVKRNKLVDLIEKSKPILEDFKNNDFEDSKLNDLKDKIIDEITEYATKGQVEVDLVDALLNTQKPDYTEQDFVKAFEKAKEMLNEINDDSLDQIIDFVKDPENRYFELAKKKANGESITPKDLADINKVHANNASKSPVFESALVKLLPDSSAIEYKDIEQMFRDVWALDNLSKAEKYELNLGLLEHENYHTSDRYKAKALFLNEAKQYVIDQINENEDLNPAQKAALAKEVKDLNLVSFDVVQPDSLAKILEKAQEQVEAKKELQSTLDKIQNPSEKQQELIDQIKDQLNKEALDSVVLHELNQKLVDLVKDELKNEVSQNSDLFSSQKTDLSQEIDNASLDELQALKSTISKTVQNNKELVEKLKDDLYSLSDQVEEIDDKDLNDLFTVLKENQELSSDFKYFQDLDVNDSNFDVLLNNLSDLANSDHKAKEMPTIIDELYKESKKGFDELRQEVLEFISLVNAVKDMNTQAIDNIKNNSKNEDLNKALESLLNQKPLSNREISKLDLPKVIKSLVAKKTQNDQENTQAPDEKLNPWWFIALGLLTLGLSVAIPLLIKKSK
ncbi:lipoprotein 17-related variable surface protein [Mycoplasma sp. Ms02]|uniref:lipoprotein 17-related variable surface protein n=1 Tax=Mycoplasma sp. Ms02 TaxID=353851 RepID=UPI001C89DAB2|nr:lipoprotein 17-related variable surface protein [Mycoplasma sp. Ms02]QZE12468.1 hypothetical protein K4L35_00540 [Mycoplasma sp. Ms02]